jgi:hypothetical protein
MVQACYLHDAIKQNLTGMYGVLHRTYMRREGYCTLPALHAAGHVVLNCTKDE